MVKSVTLNQSGSWMTMIDGNCVCVTGLADSLSGWLYDGRVATRITAEVDLYENLKRTYYTMVLIKNLMTRQDG